MANKICYKTQHQMKTKLFINLVLTTIISFVLCCLLFWVLLKVQTLGFEGKQGAAIIYIIIGSIELTVIPLLTLPLILSIDETNYTENKTMFLFIFLVPIIVFIVVLLFILTALDSNFVLEKAAPAVIFAVVHYLFYRKFCNSIY